jgi:hypothetical protein
MIKDFDRKEQMRPLNSGKDKEGKHKRIDINKDDIYLDHKGGFEATRSRLKSGEFGFWAKLIGVDGIGGEASISASRSETDTYKFNSVDTEFFYPSPNYISQCMGLSDVEDYIKGWEYKKPVYLVTGIKVAKGVSVRVEGAAKMEGKLELGLNCCEIQAGPRAEAKVENKPVSVFTASSDIVVGIQCLKIYYKTSWFGGGKQRREEVYTHSATFLDNDNRELQKEQPHNFIVAGLEDYKNPFFVAHQQPTEEGEEDEIWILPLDSE